MRADVDHGQRTPAAADAARRLPCPYCGRRGFGLAPVCAGCGRAADPRSLQRARGDHAVGTVLRGSRTGAFFALVAMGVLALVQQHGCVPTRVVAVAFLVSGSAASLGPGVWFLFRRRFLGAFAWFAGAFIFLVIVPGLTYSAFTDPTCRVLQWHRDFNAPQ